ncbi:MAG: hypothetical protein MJE77_20865 [Proteobacteria bacterium]|nr:hypothetical protein [Pseudomonadota bacterium]
MVELIDREQPDVIHVSAHCDGQGRLLLVGQDDPETYLEPAQLAAVLDKLKPGM